MHLALSRWERGINGRLSYGVIPFSQREKVQDEGEESDFNRV
jgi:hypothetical protein